ncbi:MAG: NAD(P)/FAD-dependent oxidoreductase [Candidatus Hadarchaeales archaeon]
MPEKYDVVVIGGGVAGLAAARAAASEGAKTIVLEMRAGIGEHGGFGIVLPRHLLRRFKVMEKKVESLTIASQGKRAKVEKRMAVVRRREVLEALSREAVAAGAEMWINCPVQALVFKDGVVRGVRAEGGGWAETIVGEVVIDASGASGQWSSLFLRKVLEGDWRPEQLVFSSEYMLANAGGCDPELHFTTYLAPAGKCWVYPMRDDFASAGICGIRIHPDTALDEFLGKAAQKAVSGSVPVKASRSQLPISGPLKHTCGDGILAAGAAAGQVFPTAPESISLPFLCGEIAGKAAVDAITDGDVRRAGLQRYEERWRATVGEEIEACRIFHSSITAAQDERIGKIIDVFNDNPSVMDSLINVYLGIDVGKSLRRIARIQKLREIIGEDAASKITELLRG